MKKQKEKRPTVGRKYNKLGSLIWALKKMWALDRKFVFFIFATIPVAIALPLVQSYFAKVLIDSIGLGAEITELAAICVGFISAITILKLLGDFIDRRCWSRQYYPTMVYQRDIFSLYNYYTDFENTELQEYDELLGYASADATRGDCSLEFIWKDISQTLINAFGIITYASLLVYINPVVFLIVVIVSVLSYFTTRWQTVYYENHKHEWEKETRKVEYLHNLSDNFPMAKDIKLYGLEGWLDQMMRDYQTYILMWNKKCSIRGVWAAILSGLMTLIQDGAAYIFLISLLLEGNIGVGDFTFYFGIVGSIAGFMLGIMMNIAKLNTRADKIDYYRNLYDYPNKFNHGKGCTVPVSDIKIEFRDVWYKYIGAEDYTIKGLNLTIEPGESIALVGMNGAGKTTLVKLICGLYAPTKGEILVNGKRIDQYNIEEYYTLISAVFQEIDNVAFTIQEFVTSSDPDKSTAKDDAIAALKSAGIWEKVSSLPYGIDTHLQKGVYEDAVDLSGGQMQKLLLARAIYKDGPILILDEPTAALDPIAENNLYLQYRELTKGKTSIYISHRFASTRFCDRIILLQDGVITESGTHDELMALNGQYAYMFGVQSQYYKEGEVHA